MHHGHYLTYDLNRSYQGAWARKRRFFRLFHIPEVRRRRIEAKIDLLRAGNGYVSVRERRDSRNLRKSLQLRVNNGWEIKADTSENPAGF